MGEMIRENEILISRLILNAILFTIKGCTFKLNDVIMSSCNYNSLLLYNKVFLIKGL